MRRKVIWIVAAIVVVAAGAGGWWWRRTTAWRDAVPAQLPPMSGAVAEKVNALLAKVWAGGQEAKTAAGELAMVYQANGYLESAAQAYRVLATKRPDEPQWAYRLSELLGSAGRLEEARPWLQQAVAAAPDRPLLRRKLGDLLAKQGRWPEAGAAYAAVLAQQPDDPYALLGTARVAVEDERWLEARRTLEKLIGANPTFAGGLSLLATVDDVLGETRRAEEMRRRAESAGRFREERDPWADEVLEYCLTSYGLRVAAAATDDPAWATKLLTRATELEPDVAANWQQLGRVRQKSGDLDGAQAAFERAIAIAPTDGQVWLDRVALARARKDLPEVFKEVTAGLAQCPDDAGLNYELGRARVQAEQWEAAVAPLERAITLDPYNQTAAVELVALWFRLEQPAKAEAVMDAALTRDPDFAPMLEFLVRFHVRAGRRAEAEAALARLAKAPNHETALANARKELATRFGLTQ